MTEREIFAHSLEFQNPADRAAFLEWACGSDVALRERIDRLLAERENLGSYLEAPVAPAPTVDQPSTTHAGQRIGRYRLLEQIGEGAMGTVWVAEQTEPVKRRVAVKLIKPGMDTRHVLSRFEAERQALALMDHPNIAKVHDGGMTDEGRPFFVMEYVKGVPITDYCDAARLTIQQRLQLFIPVCQAVQHAHQKGVIHRDLKPSNILVCLYDGQPVPKVIDFGLAKAISQPLTEHSLYTAHGMMVGTPLYMSPEQAEFNNLDIDTRADVYSLGVILYELLTGSTPLEKQQFKDAAFQEVLRLIKEVEPPKPSNKLSSSASLPSIAAQRSLEPALLSRLVKGDLDWIVMKSLEKERSHRYDTANALARDIERHLHDEPVEAGPPSAIYRLRKVLQRHKGPTVAAALVLAALVAGLVGLGWGLVEAERGRLLAERKEKEAQASARAEADAKQQTLQEKHRAEEALVEARHAQHEAELQKKDADESRADTQSFAKFLIDDVLSVARPEGQDGGLGIEVTVKQALDASSPKLVVTFAGRPRAEAKTRLALGTTYLYLGDYATAIQHLERARDLFRESVGPNHRESLECSNDLAWAYREAGRTDEALALFEETVRVMKERLGPTDFYTLTTMGNLAGTYRAKGQMDKALSLHEETLKLMKETLGRSHQGTLISMNNLAATYRTMGKLAEALPILEETLNLKKDTLGPTHPDTLQTMNSLAVAYSAARKLPQALALHEDTLKLRKEKLGPTHPDTLISMYNLASTFALVGRGAEAVELLEETLKHRKEKLGPTHSATIMSTWMLAAVLVRLNRSAEAVRIIDEYLEHAARKNAFEPRQIPAVIDLRLDHFVKAQDGVGCRETAEMWERFNRTDAGGLYKSARLRAISARVIRAAKSSNAAAEEADAEADRAVVWLQKAVAAGYNNAAQLTSDKDLDELRSRDDFQKLLADLQSGNGDAP